MRTGSGVLPILDGRNCSAACTLGALGAWISKKHCQVWRDEIYKNPVFILMHRCHGMRRSKISRDSAAAAACSVVRFRPWGALTASQVPRCTPATPDHSATIGGHVGSAAGDPAWRLPSPCPWARPQPPPRHSSACWSAPGSALCAAIPAAHTCTIAEIFVRLGAAAGGGSKLRRDPAVARQPPRGFAAPGASASARLAPWKDRLRCTFPRRRPRAICGHPRAHKRIGRLFSSLQDLLFQLILSR
jgi:hypothetical protein